MEKASDEELLAKFLAGERTAFEELARRYEKRLVRFLMRYIRDVYMAEEIFQETFVRVYRKASSFQEGRKFRTWLYTIALNLARTEMSKLKKRPPAKSLDAVVGSGDSDRESTLSRLITSEEHGPREKAALKEAGELIEKALMELSERHREVFVLYHYEHLNYEEIAETVGRPVGTVKSQMHYALKDLRAKLERTGLSF